MIESHMSMNKQRGGKRLQTRCPPDRLEFLCLLVSELQQSVSEDAKQQIVANLANFSYDPSNYTFLRRLGILDLFLQLLSNNNVTLCKFALAGICNCCLDGESKQYILKHNGVPALCKLLASSDADILGDVMATLMFLVTPEYHQEIATSAEIARISELANSHDRRVRNLARVFLSDYLDS